MRKSRVCRKVSRLGAYRYSKSYKTHLLYEWWVRDSPQHRRLHIDPCRIIYDETLKMYIRKSGEVGGKVLVRSNKTFNATIKAARKPMRRIYQSRRARRTTGRLGMTFQSSVAIDAVIQLKLSRLASKFPPVFLCAAQHSVLTSYDNSFHSH